MQLTYKKLVKPLERVLIISKTIQSAGVVDFFTKCCEIAAMKKYTDELLHCGIAGGES